MKIETNPLWKNAPKGVLTTGIGSLPYHNVDAALAHAFSLRVPFLPQIPLRHVTEYMIPQALEGLPGLICHGDGMAQLDLDRWSSGAHAFGDKIKTAFAGVQNPNAFEDFEPTPSGYSAWRGFLFELEERKISFAKIEIAGPLTTQWSVSLSDGSRMQDHPDLSSQIFQLVLARATAMVRALKARNIQPLIFLDEPGLYIVSPKDPNLTHQVLELKIFVQALKKEGALVGLHCCSETDWRPILSLGLDVLSLDTHLSLDSLLQHPKELGSYVQTGGRLALGVIPTGRVGQFFPQWDATELFRQFTTQIHAHLSLAPELLHAVLRSSIYTPACGLALHPVEAAETILGCLSDFARLLEKDPIYGKSL